MSRKVCYKTVSQVSKTELVEKKSRFISDVSPVQSEAEALAFLAGVKAQYPDATHHVYAYCIDENNIFRYSDDGEPSGTAGMPVLDTIRKEGLVDVCVVVTRYFGGTLLGTGGLVHAYGASARQGLVASKIVTRTLCNMVYVKVPYDLVGRVQHFIATNGYILEGTDYGTEVTFAVCCKLEDTERFMKDIVNQTNGRAITTVLDQKYIDV